MHKMFYDGVEISKYVVIEDIQRPLINISASYSELPGVDGLVFKNKKNDEKIVEVRVRLIEELFNKSLNDTKDILNLLLVKDKPCKLELSDYPDRYELCILDGNIKFDKFLSTGMTILTFKNPSGIFYSKDINTTTKNVGNKKCPVIIEGTISSNLVTITHNNSLKKITINTTGFTGQKLTIDTGLEEVKLNNNIFMKSLHFESDFFYLELGENQITITGLSSITYSSRARWL